MAPWMVVFSLPLVTSIMVPFAILLQYWRRLDSVDLPTVARTPGASARWRPVVRRQVLSSRLASGIAFTVSLLCVEGLWFPHPASDESTSFVVPITIAAVCVAVFLLASAGQPRDGGERLRPIDLRPRHLWSFGRGWWFASSIVVAVLLVATVILAGLGSSLDDQGRFAVLTVVVGKSAGGSTTFLGWYFGVPILIAVAALTAVTLASLWAGARPALASAAEERSIDVWLRQFRTRTVLCLVGGALVLTLGWSLMMIGNAGQFALELPTGTLGVVKFETALAACSVPLRVAGLLAQGAGLALLLLPLFTQTPRAVARASADVPADTGDALVPQPRA